MITLVVGAQYGGEGKGKISAFLAWRHRFDVACRCGGPNSSHTVVHNGREFRLRMMPAAAVIRRDIDVYFGAGTLIHWPTLEAEMAETDFKGRLLIDPNAGVVTQEIVDEQRQDDRYGAIGSTLTGTGYAASLRSLRKLELAKDFSELKEYTHSSVSTQLRSDILEKRSVLVEGHQGYGLSNYHGDYPFTSSRDSTASEMLSELGLGPNQEKMRIVLATKIFPTRNHAGHLGDELCEADADALGIKEYGGGAWGIPNRRRRVSTFDTDLVVRAAFANSATEIALTGADYLDRNLRGRRKLIESEPLEDFLFSLSKAPLPPVRLISTSPSVTDVIEIANQKTVRIPKPGRDNSGDLFQ